MKKIHMSLPHGHISDIQSIHSGQLVILKDDFPQKTNQLLDLKQKLVSKAVQKSITPDDSPEVHEAHDLEETPRCLQKKLEMARKNNELFNMPAQVETKNLMKFEREFEKIVNTKKGRNKGYNLSIDFTNNKVEISNDVLSKEISLP